VASIGQPQDVIEAAVIGEPGVQLDVVADDTMNVPQGDANLASRAADAVLMRAGRHALGVRLTLRKRIPPGAGLGGGSADAAATLMVVRRLLELDVSDQELLELAADLGSDVPFCVRGGAAWMRGRGEELEPANVPLGLPLLLAIPPFGLLTADVYRTWDEMGGPRARRTVRSTGRLAALTPVLSNDLEPAAEELEPRLQSFREELEDAAGAPALMAGSGSSYVVPVDDERGVTNLAAEVSQRMRRPVFAVATVSRGVRIES